MRFVLRMAARETRASWKRLLFFFACVAIGAGAIVAVRSVVESVRTVLVREARSMIAADLLLSTNRPLDDRTRASLDRRLTDPAVLARTDAIEVATMVRPAGGGKRVARMAELRGVGGVFPLYGRVVLEDDAPYSHRLVEDHGALVRPELLTQLGVGVGDAIIVGSQAFTIRGVIATEPGGQLDAFSLGPRVLVDYDDLRATGLLGFGSRAQYQILLRVRDADVDRLARALRAEFVERFISVRSYRSTEDAVGKDLDNAESYLSLVGLAVMILGGIGVSSVTRVFVQQKIKAIAVLKCVGARTRQILAVYLIQVLALGLAGSLFGILLARAAVAAIPAIIGESASILADVRYGLTGPAVIQGIGLGLLVSLLFSIAPLLEVRHIRPSLLLRHEPAPRGGADWLRRAVVGGVGIALVGLTAWQVASVRIGLIACVAFAGLTVALHGAGAGLVRAIAPLRQSRWFPLRHASLHLARPGNQTRVILLAVGLGSFFIIGVRSLQANLLREFTLEAATDEPDMFLIDVQPDQRAPLAAFAASRPAEVREMRLIPLLRARVTGVRGRETNLDNYQDVRGRGSLGREYGVTYRDHLERNERIVQGRFWSGPSPDAEVSIEQEIHQRFNINVGDMMRFDILGRTINARVTSIRRVEWRNARRGRFVFVFRPGVVDRAPHTWLASVRGPDDPAARARLQRDLVDRFPNVSVIDLHEVLDAIRSVLSKVTFAISIVGGLMLLGGGLILVGAVAMTKFQRVYEVAIMKTLGASTRVMAAMLLLEYGMLGVLAGTVGSLGAIGLAWGIARYVLDLPWQPSPMEHLGGVLVTVLLVTGIGVLASLDVLRHKPLATLRAE